MLNKGQVLNNRYQIHAILGEGGFGAVYKVWDDTLQRYCAIKENLQVSAEAQKQFKREATMLANLNHPHLVRVTDYFFIPNQGQYLVMDYVEGDDLQTILTKNEGPLSVEQSLTWIRQICDALIYIHSQNPPIIHRDIKPANIRINIQRNAILVDFGLAKEFDDSVKTTIGARGLTPHFAAPEQYGMGGTDAQSDIYSLGVTLYCMLTYRVPPDSVEIMVGNANPPSPVNVIDYNIPDSVSDAIEHAMQIRRTDRYKSVNDFKNALDRKLKVPAQKKAEPIWANSKKIILSNGMEFIHIPAGTFLMGEKNRKHTVNISYEFWMSHYPVTNEQYNYYVNAKRIIHPVEKWEEKKDHPVYKVTWYEAMDYCAWLNNLLKAELPSEMIIRLPTEAEWEKAARGTDGREYPWGNTFDKNKCNSEETKKYGTTPVSLYSPSGDSPYGCSDMVGNVSEWTHSISKGYPYNAEDGREDEKSPLTRVIRGGAYFLHPRFLSCAFNSMPQFPESRNGSSGFRVAVSNKNRIS